MKDIFDFVAAIRNSFNTALLDLESDMAALLDEKRSRGMFSAKRICSFLISFGAYTQALFLADMANVPIESSENVESMALDIIKVLERESSDGGGGKTSRRDE